MSLKKEADELVDWLTGIGFEVVSGGKHWKVTHPDAPGRSGTVAKTPGDWRSLKNTRAQLRTEFAEVNVDWGTAPGVKQRSQSTLHDRMTGTKVVGLLQELADAKGNPAFAGRVAVPSTDDARVLVIRNPFHVRGSQDAMRRVESVVVQLPRTTERLGPLAVAALQDLGVDLTCATTQDLQQHFSQHARMQRTAMILEHAAQKANQHAIGRQFPSAPGVSR